MSVGLAEGVIGVETVSRMVRAATVATSEAALPNAATGSQFASPGPASTAAIDGAKPPNAKPNWVPTATPDIRTLVLNCSANIAKPTPP